MASEDSLNRLQDGTHCQTPETVNLCANGCGFFGSAATLNLCSVCYREHQAKQTKAASAKAAVAVEKPLGPVAVLPSSSAVVPSSSSSSSSSSSPGSEVAAEPAPAPAPQVKNRCFTCRKRVGLTGFSCRCGSTFCGTHRYPEAHACGFDYKTVEREQIAKANPVVVKDKLERI